jgi:hypothetical protein
MADLQTIEIDFDVHKRIELERTSFTETPNAVLRRLLSIDGCQPATEPPLRAVVALGQARP